MRLPCSSLNICRCPACQDASNSSWASQLTFLFGRFSNWGLCEDHEMVMGTYGIRSPKPFALNPKPQLNPNSYSPKHQCLYSTYGSFVGYIYKHNHILIHIYIYIYLSYYTFNPPLFPTKKPMSQGLNLWDAGEVAGWAWSVGFRVQEGLGLTDFKFSVEVARRPCQDPC